MLKANVKLLVEKTLEPGDYLCKTIVIDTSEYPPELTIHVKVEKKIERL